MGNTRTATAVGAVGSQPSVQLHQRPMAETSRLTGEQMFLTQLKVIERITSAATRRSHLSTEEAEEFTAVVHLHLIKDDYGILRQFVGRSTLKTFLTVVIQRLLVDFQNSRWGKWRPSAASREYGPVAVILERLTIRDGWTFDEACTLLAASHDLSIDRRSLERLHGLLRVRLRPKFVADISLDDLPSASDAPDSALQRTEEAASLATAIRQLTAAAVGMAPQDQLILKLHFADRLPLSTVARQLNLNQKALYRRMEKLLGRLRTRLECLGVRREEVLPVIGKHDSAAVFSAAETTKGWLADASMA